MVCVIGGMKVLQEHFWLSMPEWNSIPKTKANLAKKTSILVCHCLCLFTFSVINGTEKNLMQFSIHSGSNTRQLEVTNASLYILVRYKKNQQKRATKRLPNRKRKLHLKVYMYDAETGQDRLVTSLRTMVGHNKWVRMLLPSLVTKDILSSPNKTQQLLLRVTCDRCSKRLRPVLVHKKHPSVSNRRNMFSTLPPKSNKLNKRRPFLVISTQKKPKHKKRHRKRSASCRGRTSRCCKRNLYVSFVDLGWSDWILAPTGYQANYCTGRCTRNPLPFDLMNKHSTVISEFVRSNRNTEIQFCCAPKKYAPVSIIYIDISGNIIQTQLPDMSVEECACA